MAGTGDHFGGQGKQPQKKIEIRSSEEIRQIPTEGGWAPLKDFKSRPLATGRQTGSWQTGRLADWQT